MFHHVHVQNGDNTLRRLLHSKLSHFKNLRVSEQDIYLKLVWLSAKPSGGDNLFNLGGRLLGIFSEY